MINLIIQLKEEKHGGGMATVSIKGNVNTVGTVTQREKEFLGALRRIMDREIPLIVKAGGGAACIDMGAKPENS
jgi:hypothetical protein